MGMLHMDSFDDRLGAGLGGERYDGSTVTGAHSGTSAGGRTANYLYLAAGEALTKNLGTNAATLVAGFAFLLPSLATPGRCFAFGDAGTVQVSARVNGDGTLSVLNGTGGAVLCTSAAALSVGLWQYLEIKVRFHATLGAVTVRLNGLGIARAVNVNTRVTANAYANQATVQWTGTGPAGYDDLYAVDQTTGQNNDFLGSLKIECLHPSGTGTHTTFTPVGQSANWDCVKDATANDDTDYVHTDIPGQSDTYLHGPLSTLTATVAACQVVLRARNDDIGNRTIAPVLRSGGSDFVLASVTVPGTSYQELTAIVTNDPATGAAWAPVAVNGCEVGVTLLS